MINTRYRFLTPGKTSSTSAFLSFNKDPSLTFPAGSPLNEKNRWLLQLLRPPAHPLQLADIPVGHPVAPAHRLGGFAHADAALASPPYRHAVRHPAGHRALQPLSAHRVPQLAAAAARFALAGRAHRAAVADVQRLSGRAVGRQPRAHRLVAPGRASDDIPVGLRARWHRRQGGDYAQRECPEHVSDRRRSFLEEKLKIKF